MKHDVLMTGPMYPVTIAELEKVYTVHRLWTAPDKDGLVASVADRITALTDTSSETRPP